MSAASTDDSIYNHLRHESSQSKQLENTRLLYVAATRAINCLYLTFTQDQVYDVEEIKAPGSQTLLHSVWPVVKEQAIYSIQQQQGADQLAIDFDQHDKPGRPTRLKTDWKNPEWSFSNPLAQYSIAADYQNEDNRPDFKEDLYPRQLGNIVHAILEYKAKTGSSSLASLSSEQKNQWYKRLLQREGVSAEKWKDAVVMLKQMESHVENDDKGRWLLSMRHQHALAEYEILVCSYHNGVDRRVIDRTFIDENNIRWIVDYKTSMPKSGEDIKPFIEREINKYREQLMHYKALITSLNEDSHVIKMALYFPMIPYWCEVS
ncbi:MAG: ATP-dependent exoDNAse (exonuclease V) beta subunit [Pseudohongiellaceae bacterium]